MNDVVIKAGNILHVNIEFVGEPTPEAIWSVGSKTLTADSRTTVSCISSHTVIHTVNCKRSDSGSYHLLLRNSSGIDEGSFNITVLGNFLQVSCFYISNYYLHHTFNKFEISLDFPYFFLYALNTQRVLLFLFIFLLLFLFLTLFYK